MKACYLLTAGNSESLYHYTSKLWLWLIKLLCNVFKWLFMMYFFKAFTDISFVPIYILYSCYMNYSVAIIICVSQTLHGDRSGIRAPVCNPDLQAEQLQSDVAAYVNLVIDHLPATEKWLIEIQKAQEEDSICQQVRLFCHSGWSENEKLYKQFTPCAAVRFELNIVCGLLVRGNHIVIPSKLCSDMIEKLHAGHQEVLKISLAVNVVA